MKVDRIDCPHPNAGVVIIEAEFTVVSWCALCGSIRDNNGDHGAPAGTWRTPGGIVLPGWVCHGCFAFNGSAKELLTACRSCGTSRLTTDTGNGRSEQ